MNESDSSWSDNPHYGVADGPSEYNFTHTTSTGLQFQCFVHDISSRPTLSSDNKMGIAIAMSANAVIPMALNLQKCAPAPAAAAASRAALAAPQLWQPPCETLAPAAHSRAPRVRTTRGAQVLAPEEHGTRRRADQALHAHPALVARHHRHDRR